ncbi:MAG: glycoside hydrolase family 28 protein [Bryobacteraceae bacterium]
MRPTSVASLALLGAAQAVVLLAGPVCDPRALGAKADGRTKDTRAIQAAIDECAAKGGGTVRLTAGTYLSAPVWLKTGITLELGKGAVLLGSPDFDDYPVRGETIWQGVPAKRPLALVDAADAADVRIIGEGTIDGGGAPWWKAYRAQKKAGGGDMPRPWLVEFSRCRRVLMEGVTLRDSPSYTVVPYFSRDVTIRDIKIYAPPDAPNTDGIAPYSSHHVLITKCLIDTGDDNVAIKSSAPTKAGEDSSASDITVSDCTFLHGHGATIGADTGGGIHGVAMERVRLEGTQYGLRIKSGRGFAGEVDHIVYRDIVMTAADPAVSVTAYYPSIPKQDAGQPVSSSTPRFHDIALVRVKSEGAKEAGVVIGLPESPIRNFTMEDVDIAAGKGLTVRDATVILRRSHIRAQSGPAIIREQNANVDEDDSNKEKSGAQ